MAEARQPDERWVDVTADDRRKARNREVLTHTPPTTHRPRRSRRPHVRILGYSRRFLAHFPLTRRFAAPLHKISVVHFINTVTHRGRRGAPLTRRDDREYREYLREEQRSQRGCIGGRMQLEFHHGLLGLLE